MPRTLGVTRVGRSELRWGERTYIMGIVNVTPDSFSGDGLGGDVKAALEQARRFADEGADIIDVGGESTRPGAQPVDLEEERRRVLPSIERIAAAVSVPVSVDTYKAQIAREAIAAGAAMINDVWGLKKDARLAEAASAAGVPLVLMHNQETREYAGLLADIVRSLGKSVEQAKAAGVRWENIIVDPGIGFGKTKEHNLEVMRRLRELRVLGRPILLGASRKSTIGLVLDLPPGQRLEGTAATVAIGIANGADIVRVHEVREMARVARMADAIVRFGVEGG